MAANTAGFDDIGIVSWLGRHISAVGFKEPTEVQKQCIPPILAGRDCIGCSRTGSGKTAAFALPIVQKLAEDPYGIYALVITPTRELAFQLSEQFLLFGKSIGIKTAVVVGGIDMMAQSCILAQKPHIVIATPGRLADHLITSDSTSLQSIKYLVLDEADRLLEDGFSMDLLTIFTNLPQERQTLIFGATITNAIKHLNEIAKSDVFTWKSSLESVDSLDQRYVLMPAHVKECYFLELVSILLKPKKKKLIVFTNTCRSCQMYSLLLNHHSYPCVPLHSQMSQMQRLSSVLKFKCGQVNILVATDVASRGLDIPDVNYVINTNVPASSIDYIHRVGRTARAGRCGMSVTFVTQFEIFKLQSIEEYTGCKLAEYKVDEQQAVNKLHTVGKLKREIQLVFP